MTIQEPTTNEHGDEEHPAFALIGASRVSSGPPGAALFDSDIRHQHYVVVKISTAVRSRNLNRDWVHSRDSFVEVAMSEAQWASFVSSMNTGDGVSCTLTSREHETMPRVPYAPRLAQSMAEVRGAAEEATAKVAEAFATYQANKTKANLHTLEWAIKNMPSNMAYAAKSLSEHAENVVQRARADIEAMVMTEAKRLGIEANALGTLELTSGDSDE